MVVLPSILVAAAVFLFALWYVRSRNYEDARLRSLSDQQRAVTAPAESFGQRVVFPAVDSGARFVMAILPTSVILRSRKWLVTAGDTLTLPQFMTVVLVVSTLPSAFYFALAWVGTNGEPSALSLFPLLVIFPMSLIAPFMTLRRMAKNRQTRIWRTMPNALDLLTTCVEAGLSLDFALQRVADRYAGPLADEIHRMLREIALGKTRREALTDMANRIDLPDMVTFVNSIVQAETLGTSVGQVLRVQANQMRIRRRQRAEQIARQAPVKMVFPTVFLLMPSLFLITIGPMMLNVIDTFRNS